MFGHTDFYRMVTEAFPELQAELDEDPELLHVQMGAFARFTEQAKGRGDWPTYQRCIALADVRNGGTTRAARMASSPTGMNRKRSGPTILDSAIRAASGE